MSVGFGFSVGDFLAALKLVGTVTDALRESSHAGSSFRELLTELYLLESVLLRVKQLDLDDRNNVNKLALRQAASQCQRTIDAFWKDMQKFQPHLQQNGTNSRTRDGWAKIKWAVCKKKDLETFQAQIRAHTDSIGLLLLSVQLEATTVNARNQDSYNKSLASRLQDLSCQTMGKLSAITDSVAQCVQQGKALLESSVKIVETNLRVFQMVRDIQLFILRIPGQVQRQQPVYLIDAFNMESPFHLEFVRSAEALLAVLKVNIKRTGCDPDVIDRGQFVIEESGTQNVIDLTGPWGGCFYPGQRVAMSVIVKQQMAHSSQCPKCGKDYVNTAGQEIICIVCGTILSRVEGVKNVRKKSRPSHSSDKLDSGDVPTASFTGPALPAKRKEQNHALTNVQKFRRIRLLMYNVMHVCCICKKMYSRPCDLIKHEKTHSRPWKCTEVMCKFYELGWPTEKERDVHLNLRHSPQPPQFKCLFPPCSYLSIRLSNCKYHMESVHGWKKVPIYWEGPHEEEQVERGSERSPSPTRFPGFPQFAMRRTSIFSFTPQATPNNATDSPVMRASAALNATLQHEIAPTPPPELSRPRPRLQASQL